MERVVEVAELRDCVISALRPSKKGMQFSPLTDENAATVKVDETALAEQPGCENSVPT